jgi:hypothetical protein
MEIIVLFFNFKMEDLSMMEFLLFNFGILAVYITAVYVAAKLAVDKLNARSGLFGAGIVTMFTGFIMHNIIEWSGDRYWNYVNDDLPFMYYALLYGFLIMGMIGIVMIAVDLLKAVNDLGGYVSRVDEKQSAIQTAVVDPKEMPAWKRVQMEQEEK